MPLPVQALKPFFPKDVAEIFSDAIGITINEKEIMAIGRRILTLEKCFNVREGADRRLDDLPWRMMNEPLSWGSMEGMVSSREWLDEMLDRYYKLHGWDLKTGWPYRKALGPLDLRNVADQLEMHRELPREEKN